MATEQVYEPFECDKRFSAGGKSASSGLSSGLDSGLSRAKSGLSYAQHKGQEAGTAAARTLRGWKDAATARLFPLASAPVRQLLPFV